MQNLLTLRGNSISMRNLSYRLPRFEAEVTIDFIYGESVVLGTCRNISESGCGVSFPHPLQPGLEGAITFYYKGQSYEARARVSSRSAGKAALQFTFTCEEDHAGVRALLRALHPESPAAHNPAAS